MVEKSVLPFKQEMVGPAIDMAMEVSYTIFVKRNAQLMNPALWTPHLGGHPIIMDNFTTACTVVQPSDLRPPDD